MKRFILFILFLYFATTIRGAIIKGDIFLPDFSKPNISIIEINTTPPQSYVVFNGTYSLNISNGKYNLTVYFVENSSLFQSTKIIEIRDNNTYNIDFILFPYSVDDNLIDIIEEPDFSTEIRQDNSNMILDGLIIIIALLILFYLIKSKMSKNKEVKLPPDLLLIIRILKSKENRALQKELRDELKWSEAKLSLALSELEHLGYIRRIKKGRGNIISLLKDYNEN